MTNTWYTENGVEWVKDESGNRCSVEYFGSKEEAEKALNSLENCRDCINCSDCPHCSDCFRCFRCSGCSDCSDCFRCFRCSGCSGCSGCSDCFRLEGVKNKDAGKESPRPKTPKIENIHQKVYEAASQPDALNMADWHTCETTHCRAGWVNHLAGEQGKKMEAYFGHALAAQLIYAESSPHHVPPTRFFDSNEKAMADMKRLAELEASAPEVKHESE